MPEIKCVTVKVNIEMVEEIHDLKKKKTGTHN